MWEDPLVEEVRKRRRELMAEYDNDLGKLIDYIKKERKKYSNRLIRVKKKKIIKEAINI